MKFHPLEISKEYEPHIPPIAEEMGIPRRYLGARLHDFDVLTVRKCAPWESLFITGGVGSGKTHLAAALLLELAISKRLSEWEPADWHEPGQALDLKHGETRDFFEPYAFRRVPFFAQAARNAATNGDLSRFLEAYYSRSLLVLDDLGATRDTAFLEDSLYLVVSERYDEQLPTIYTSNLSLEQIAARIGDRIASRISGTCHIVDLGNRDRRANP